MLDRKFRCLNNYRFWCVLITAIIGLPVRDKLKPVLYKSMLKTVLSTDIFIAQVDRLTAFNLTMVAASPPHGPAYIHNQVYRPLCCRRYQHFGSKGMKMLTKEKTPERYIFRGVPSILFALALLAEISLQFP